MEIAILAGSDVFIGSYIYPIQSFSAFLLTISNFHRFILNRRFFLKYIYDKHVEIRTYLHNTAKYVFAARIYLLDTYGMYIPCADIGWYFISRFLHFYSWIVISHYQDRRSTVCGLMRRIIDLNVFFRRRC